MQLPSWTGTLVAMLVGLLLVLFPHKAAIYNAKLMRWYYRDFLGMTDEEIDTKPKLPGTPHRFQGGLTYSQILREVDEHPEQFNQWHMSCVVAFGTIVVLLAGGCLAAEWVLTAMGVIK